MRKHKTPSKRLPQDAAPAVIRPAAGGPRGTSTSRAVWIGLALVATTTAVFAPVWGFDFVSWDDPWYVTKNPHVMGGLSWPNLIWAFTTGGEFYWHPLTWLSHMLDVSLYGMNAGGHHLTNLLLHLINTLLLFVLLRRMTGALWRSALVAALFGVHLLHVESVAWVAERKDVLSTMFWMITLAAYLRYVRRPGRGRYLAVAGAFGLGLMAKPMIVTLPLVLLLLDVWPLRRWPLDPSRATGTVAGTRADRRTVMISLIAEKAPLFAMALASGVATFIIQQQVGAMGGLDALPMHYRASNAVVSYGAYLGKMVLPTHLAAFYPYPPELPDWRIVCVALIGLAVAVSAAIRMARTYPYLIVGVLWYLATLFPVIGVFQAGGQVMADRFTYVPLIGVFLIVAWGGADLFARWRLPRPLPAAAALAVVVVYAIGAHAQVQHWQNSQTLWMRALAVTTGNHRAHAGLGEWLVAHGKFDEAARHYEEAIRLAPEGAEYRYNLGLLYMRQGRTDDAATQFALAVRLDSRHVGARVSFGAVLARKGLVSDAIIQYNDALRIDPDHALAYANLGLALMEQGRLDPARRACDDAVRLDARLSDARQCLGLVLARLGKFDEAAAAFADAVRLDADSEAAYFNLGVALSKTGRTADALKAFEGALRINPANDVVRRAVAELTRRER